MRGTGQGRPSGTGAGGRRPRRRAAAAMLTGVLGAAAVPGAAAAAGAHPAGTATASTAAASTSTGAASSWRIIKTARGRDLPGTAAQRRPVSRHATALAAVEANAHA